MARLNDLIRCEDAIKEICKRTCTPGVLCPDAYCKEVKEWITDDMVVDAVPVQRCDGCRYADWHSNGCIAYCTKHGTDGHVADGYCSEGEKDGEQA